MAGLQDIGSLWWARPETRSSFLRRSPNRQLNRGKKGHVSIKQPKEKANKNRKDQGGGGVTSAFKGRCGNQVEQPLELPPLDIFCQQTANATKRWGEDFS